MQTDRISEGSLWSRLPEGARPGGLKLTRRLVNCCGFAPNAKVTDIGCGIGATVEYLRDKCGLDPVGVDISEASLQKGRERSAGLLLVRAAGDALPFAGGSVQGVLAECSLSVMEDMGRVLDEIHRILVPGGKLAVTDLYLREPDPAPPDAAADSGRIAGVLNQAGMLRLIEAKAFRLLLWEDHTVLLKEFVAGFIMAHGSLEELQSCMPAQGGRQNWPAARQLGYCLLVAEKSTLEVTE
ncbi:type 11 methyltransferase [Acetonema longum DSM 6540]|uniref:Type 11 methyltransferase n=2 Tax=Acetonema TaxID=2373 RepID=F7NEC5_9FIRM|nr:type 11 methyltransferase [Acetonema longum DSM 6540]